jgi:hypothetical protein
LRQGVKTQAKQLKGFLAAAACAVEVIFSRSIKSRKVSSALFGEAWSIASGMAEIVRLIILPGSNGCQ